MERVCRTKTSERETTTTRTMEELNFCCDFGDDSLNEVIINDCQSFPEDHITWHKHKCSKCGFIWEHSERMLGNTAAHTCICGKEEWYKYWGNKKADFVGCGAPTTQMSLALSDVTSNEEKI